MDDHLFNYYEDREEDTNRLAEEAEEIPVIMPEEFTVAIAALELDHVTFLLVTFTGSIAGSIFFVPPISIDKLEGVKVKLVGDTAN